MNTNLIETSQEVNTGLANSFQIIRDGDSFAILAQQPSETKITTTRFRHHGPRKYRQDLVVTPQYSREDVSKATAQRIFNEMLSAGRITPEDIGNTAGDYWTLSIRASEIYDAAVEALKAPLAQFENQNSQAVKTAARDLAAKGAASRPDLAERMTKAASIVESGEVRLISHDRATVNDYRVGSDTCTCKDFEYRAPDGWCKHRLAARMARSLQQPIEPQTDAEKEAAAQARADAAHARVRSRVSQGRYRIKQEARQARRDGDGARRWIAKHQAHNPGRPIPASIYQRAYGYGQEDELAAAKAEYLAMTPEQHLQRHAEMKQRYQERKGA